MTRYRQAERPTVAKITPEHIPAEMRKADRWCVWCFEPEQDKTGELEWKKIPYQAAHIGRRASSTNPRTWSSFEMAMNVYRQGGFDGLFFAMGDGWAGVDPDEVITADGVIDPKWETEARAFKSYTEISPSGLGLRVVLHAAQSEGLRYKVGNIEAYDH